MIVVTIEGLDTRLEAIETELRAIREDTLSKDQIVIFKAGLMHVLTELKKLGDNL